MERQQQLEAEWQQAVHELTTSIGVRQQLADYLSAVGDLEMAKASTLRIYDLVHYRKITPAGIVEGWDMDYRFTDRNQQPSLSRLQINPDPDIDRPNAVYVTPAQFAVIRDCARFEGDDYTQIFRHYRIDVGLHQHLREQGIDPAAANIQIEAITRVAPDLSITTQALVVVGIMYTGANYTREIGTYVIEPGGGFDPGIPLHARQFAILEELAETITHDPRQ